MYLFINNFQADILGAELANNIQILCPSSTLGTRFRRFLLKTILPLKSWDGMGINTGGVIVAILSVS